MRLLFAHLFFHRSSTYKLTSWSFHVSTLWSRTWKSVFMKACFVLAVVWDEFILEDRMEERVKECSHMGESGEKCGRRRDGWPAAYWEDAVMTFCERTRVLLVHLQECECSLSGVGFSEENPKIKIWPKIMRQWGHHGHEGSFLCFDDNWGVSAFLIKTLALSEFSATISFFKWEQSKRMCLAVYYC